MLLSSLKVFSISINAVYTTEGSVRILCIGFRLQWASSIPDNKRKGHIDFDNSVYLKIGYCD